MKKCGILAMLFFVILTSVCLAEINNRYLLICFTDGEDFYLDTKTVKIGGKYDFYDYDVWIKSTYNETGVQKKLEELNKANIPTDGYENISHTMSHIQINYYSRQLRQLGKTDYSTDNKVLYSYNNYASEWDNIVPDSVGEIIADKIYDLRPITPKF